MSISRRRLLALCRKETYQIVRDPTSVLIAFILPVALLFLFGYAVDLDVTRVDLALLRTDGGAQAVSFEQALRGCGTFRVRRAGSRAELDALLRRGEARGAVVLRDDFSARRLRGQDAAPQVLTDGAEPNTAAFVAAYVQGVWEGWQAGEARPAGLAVRPRSWFNPGNVSRNFILPGAVAIVMTIIGSLLTSLVVAREWERGTMEALLATPVTRIELLLSKILPYYVLGLAAMGLCLAVAVLVMGVPFHGSLLALGGITTLFLACALGMGLFLSTVLRSQFNAAQAALTSAFLPALMLSGFVFEIASMPKPIQVLSLLLPARYYTRSLQTLFQAGSLPSVLWPNALALAALGALWLLLTDLKTRRSLD